MVRAYFKKIQLFFVFLFLGWISLAGQVLQLRYTIVTFELIFIIFVLSFLIELPNTFSNIDIAFLLYIFIITLGLNFYENKNFALRYYSTNIIPIFLLYFSLRKIENKQILAIASSIFFLSVLIIIIGYYEIIFRRNIIYEFWVNNPYYFRFTHQTPRMMSTLIHPTVFGSFLVGVIPFSYSIFRDFKKINRPLFIFITFLLITAVIFSFSRGNLFGLIGASILYLYLNKKIRYIKFIILLLIILLIFSSSLFKNRLSFNRFSIESISSEWWKIKLDNLRIIKKIIKDYPLLGIGLSHYQLKIKDYITEERKNLENYIIKKGYTPSEWHIPDNMYLSMLAETGILGIASFFIFLFLLYKKVIFVLKRIKDSYQRNTVISCISGITGLLISMSTYDLFYWLNPTLLLWFLVALIRSVINEF
jgi:O-antigen ligase